jgi:group II intron reverse transcriptase/maturase
MQPEAVRRRLDSLPDLAVQGKPVNGLFRLLASPLIWEMAYSDIAPNKGAATPGTDGQSLDGYSEQRVRSIIARLMSGAYRFTPARRVTIPKASGGSRPLSVPSGDDKLVQSAVRLILERIYEPVFSKHSHGFRPGRSCHTALDEIRRTWAGTVWLVDVDVEKCFDTIDHRLLLDLLGRRVQDKQFLHLIRSMLEAGYLEQWTYHRSYSGTPQGGVASPLLANVFLHELDEFMERKMASFNRGAQRRHNPAWKRAQGPVYRLCKRIDQLKDAPGAEEEILRLRSRLEQVRRAQQQVPSKDPHDPGYRRLRYCRYADDFLIGVIGTKREAEQVLSDVSDFLTTIGLRVSETKTTVVKATTGARFLGYDVRRYDSQKVFKTVRGGRHTRMRAASGNMQLHVPTEKLRAFARNRGYGSLDTITSCSRPALLRLSDAEIVSAYNAEMRGLAQFYALAYGAQSGQMHKLHFLWRGSVLKTLAHKHKSTVTKTVHVLKDGDRLGVRFEDAKGRTRLIRVWELRDLTRSPQVFGKLDDSTPPWHLLKSRTELIARFNAKVCEHCGTIDQPVEVHHVRKLADLEAEALWRQIQSGRLRKTVVLCRACHHALHAGKLPDHRKSQ